MITISQGRVDKASETPFCEAKRLLKWKTGPAWFWHNGAGPAWWITFDANHWKTRVHNGLNLSTSSRGSITLFKDSPTRHRMLADLLLLERPTKVTARPASAWQAENRNDRRKAA